MSKRWAFVVGILCCNSIRNTHVRRLAVDPLSMVAY